MWAGFVWYKLRKMRIFFSLNTGESSTKGSTTHFQTSMKMQH